MEGRRLGRYRITSKLAAGGMGAVYLATHELMGREVVIKVLLPEMSTQRDVVQRFFNEARATGNLNHPGIVAIFDLDYADDGRAYIVMERLQGETLQARLRRAGRLTVAHAIDVIKQLASAVGAAHERGIVHRDLKPANIFLVQDPEVPGRERVKVLDFGVAKLAMQQNSLVTNAGALMGTAAYMAPEQCRDAASVDHRADLYALGCIVYGCLCGRPPFVGGTIEVLAAQLRDIPVPPRTLEPSLPPWLDSLVMRLLEKDPSRRFQSCAELVEAVHGGPEARTAPPGSEEFVRHSAGTAVTAEWHRQQTDQHETGQSAPTQRMSVHAATSSTVSMASTAAPTYGGRSRRKRRVWLGLGGAALVLLGGPLLYFGLGTHRAEPVAVSRAPEQSPVPAPGAGENSHADLPQAGPDDQGENEPATTEHMQAASMAAGQSVESLLEEADNALRRKDWALAKAKAQEALQLAPGHAAATETLAVAEQEQVHAQRFREFEDALEERDFEKAEAKLASLPETSVYRQPAKAKLARARDQHETALRDAVAQAERWRDAGKCDDIQALKAAWFEIAEELQRVREQCTSPQKRANAPSTGRQNTTRDKPSSIASATSAPATPPKADRKPTPSSSDDPFDQLLSNAQNAIKRGLYGQGQRMCKEALQIRPADPRALELGIIAACNLRNAAVAKGYYVKLPASRQNPLHRLCLAKGIDLAR